MVNPNKIVNKILGKKIKKDNYSKNDVAVIQYEDGEPDLIEMLPASKSLIKQAQETKTGRKVKSVKWEWELK